jgi:hypothetical protein
VSREVYHQVPDLSWAGWAAAARPLYARLSRPATAGEIVAWSMGPDFAVACGRVGGRASLARNILAWLSVSGMVEHAGGKWRRIVS